MSFVSNLDYLAKTSRNDTLRKEVEIMTWTKTFYFGRRIKQATFQRSWSSNTPKCSSDIDVSIRTIIKKT